MDYITVSAKTLDDAITEALVELGITSDRLDYEVIEKGSTGFLGIGAKQAVIRARKKQEKPLKPERPEKPVAAAKPEKTVKEAVKETKTDVTSAVSKKEPVPRTPQPQPVVSETVKETPKEPEEAVEILDSTVTVSTTFVKDVLQAMDMGDVQVDGKVDAEGVLCIDMAGKNMGLLIGKRGQTLDSLQYLVNRVANKNQDGYVRVKLDTEDYRRRRKETLENLAHNIASKVKRTRRAVSLEPMNPYERRIIHSALQGERQISTHSEGNEPYRKVVVTYVHNK